MPNIRRMQQASAGGGADVAHLGDRGLFFGGYSKDTIDYFAIPTTGQTANDFGNLSATNSYNSACSNGTTIVDHFNSDDILEYVTVATTGNSTDFGNLLVVDASAGAVACASDGVIGRGVWGIPNHLDYVTLATPANALDFGDWTVSSRSQGGGCSNETRGIYYGGYSGGKLNSIEYITIATTGNTTDFGDILQGNNGGPAGCANDTRGVIHGGVIPPNAPVNIIQYITIASTGNSLDFGDMSNTHYDGSACANLTRGIMSMGLRWSGGIARVNIVEYVTIASTGNSTDFGDLSVSRDTAGGSSGD